MQPTKKELDRSSAIAFANELREAREAALKDAEAFDVVLHVIERIGKYLSGDYSATLGSFRTDVVAVASKSPLAGPMSAIARATLTPLPILYDLVKEARNDAMHVGAVARHLTTHLVELAIVLEDALRMCAEDRVCDYMVRDPICAELWQPIGFIRQQMLANSFSYLPVQNDDKQWCILSDVQVVSYLRAEGTRDRNERLTRSLKDSLIELSIAEPAKPGTSLTESTKKLASGPLLICAEDDPKCLLGILTAFDLL